MGLSHGLSSNELTSGYFAVNNAYPQTCTTFTKRPCDGDVIPAPSPMPSTAAGLGEACSSGVMNSCQDGLVCVPNDSGNMIVGSPGTCMMRADIDSIFINF